MVPLSPDTVRSSPPSTWFEALTVPKPVPASARSSEDDNGARSDWIEASFDNDRISAGAGEGHREGCGDNASRGLLAVESSSFSAKERSGECGLGFPRVL